MQKLVAVIAFIAVIFCNESEADSHNGGQVEKRVLMYVDPIIDSVTYRHFSSELTEAIQKALRQIQLTLVEIDPFSSVPQNRAQADMPTLFVSVSEYDKNREKLHDGHGDEEMHSVELIVGVLDSPQTRPRDLAAVMQRPLVAMLWTQENRTTFIPILSSKVVENLRTGFLSYLMVESAPAQVKVEANNGLLGTTPVEWVFTPTAVTIEAQKDGYLPYKADIDIQVPGNHKLHIQMTKRRFYHSKLLYGTLGFGLCALASYGACNYYYDQYRALEESDYFSRPDEFSNRFNRAQLLERAAGACLGIASGFFALSFWF